MIYLDNNATTIVLDEIVKQSNALLEVYNGNASSLYPYGNRAKKAIEDTRTKIRNVINASVEDQIIFTGCATESNNSVLFSAIHSYPEKKHIIVSSVEHLSILKTAQFWEKQGYEVDYISVDSDGRINLDELKQKLRPDTLLVSVMLANNETGVIFPIKQIADTVKEYNSDILVHTDAVQAIGKIPVNVKELGVDYLSMSGHKFHAPKGIGILYVRQSAPYIPYLIGGHQEGQYRAGTENNFNIIALGIAADNVNFLVETFQEKKKSLRDYMESKLEELGDVLIIGKNTDRVPNTTNVAFKGIDGAEILFKLASKGICVSTGSACNSECMEPSHVLVAMNVSEEYQHSIRVSLSAYTKGAEIEIFINELKNVINQIRSERK